MRLLRTFAPIGDESGLGVYRRLAAANALTGWKELATLCELPVARGSLLMHPELVAARLGVQVVWAQQASAAEELARGWQSHRRKSDAVCPQCCKRPAIPS
jgi:hypothetical protein